MIAIREKAVIEIKDGDSNLTFAHLPEFSGFSMIEYYDIQTGEIIQIIEK